MSEGEQMSEPTKGVEVAALARHIQALCAKYGSTDAIPIDEALGEEAYAAFQRRAGCSGREFATLGDVAAGCTTTEIKNWKCRERILVGMEAAGLPLVSRQERWAKEQLRRTEEREEERTKLRQCFAPNGSLTTEQFLDALKIVASFASAADLPEMLAGTEEARELQVALAKAVPAFERIIAVLGLSSSERDQLMKLVAIYRVSGTARLLGLPRQAVDGVYQGRSVSGGTVAAIRQALERERRKPCPGQGE